MRTGELCCVLIVFTHRVLSVEFATRRLDHAVDHIYIGDSCTHCSYGTHALKVLVRSCVPFLWTLSETSAGSVLKGDNRKDFDDTFRYDRDGTCQNLGADVHTYWEETCIHVGDLEQDCFEFTLDAHPAWPAVRSTDQEEELEHAHRNTEVVILFDDKQITVDLALVGSVDAGPPSSINVFFGGACTANGSKEVFH